MIDDGKIPARIKTGRKQHSIINNFHAALIKFATGFFATLRIIHREKTPTTEGKIDSIPIIFSLTPNFNKNRVNSGPTHTVKKNVPVISPHIKINL